MQYCSSSEDKDHMEEYEGTQMELSHDFLFFNGKTVEETKLWKFQAVNWWQFRSLDGRMWTSGGVIFRGEALSTQTESGRSPTSSTTKLICSGLRSNPVLRSVKPATKHMCRSKAYCTDCKKAVHTVLECTVNGPSFLGENTSHLECSG